MTKNYSSDYRAYTLMWQSVLNANNPWGPWGQNLGNTYGPTFILLAPFYLIHSLLPKLIFVWCWCWISHQLLRTLLVSQKKSGIRFQILYLVILFTPFFWARICIQGANDTMVAFFCFLAIRAAIDEKTIKAGLWISLGSLFKFYPLALLPFLSHRNKKINFKLIFSTLFFIFCGYLLTYLIWGESFLNPILQSYSRDSTGDSIFKFIKSEYFPISKAKTINYDWLSKYLILFFSFSVYLRHLIRPIKTEAACTLIMLIIFTFYGAGMNQYHIVVHILGLEWITKEKNLFESNKMLKVALALYFSYHSIIRPSAKLLWGLTSNKENDFFNLIPVISFPIFLFLIIAIILSPESLADYSKKQTKLL
jgi:hypothetical protein